MRKSFAAFAFAVAPPASAITFPSLTTIYVGTGVRDDGGADDTGIATSFSCTNVSGVTATIRFLVLGASGQVEASQTTTLIHGATRTASTHLEATFDTDIGLNTGSVGQGGINIESTQSGVFCNAKTIDASASSPDGMISPLVRVNPHPERWSRKTPRQKSVFRPSPSHRGGAFSCAGGGEY